MSTKFINRKQELDFLEKFLRKPNFSALLVRGEPGMGKTYMLEHFSKIAAEDGHWIHYLSIDRFQEITEVNYLFAEALSSGKFLVGKETNAWKDLLQSNPKIGNQLVPLLEYSSETDVSNSLKSIVDLITQQIPDKNQLIIVFDDITLSENTDRTVLFLESLIRAFSSNAKIKLIFSSRPLSILERLLRHHNLSALNLGEFSITSTKELVSSLISDDVISAEAVEYLTELVSKRSGGNPFYASEIIYYLRDRGLLEHPFTFTTEAFTLPDSIESLIGYRISDVIKDKDNALDLLKAVALLGRNANVDLIAELLNTNRSEIVYQVSRSSFFKLAENDSILIPHEVTRQVIIQLYIFPSEFKPTLLDFGSEEAETDHLLETSFILNNALDEIFAGHKNVILGDRGAGKSSIFRFVSDITKFPIPSDKKKQYELLSKKTLIVPCDDPVSIIQNNSLFDDPNTTPEKYKMFWMLYIGLLSGLAIYKQGDYTNPANWKDLTEILKNAGFSDTIDDAKSGLFRPVLDLITKIGSKVSFSIAGIPITLEPSAELKSEKPKVSIDISRLLELSDLIASNLEQRLFILIDRVDEIFKYQREKQEKFVQGLFLAVSHLAKYSNLSLIVFLRTDIFQIYDIQEKNKFVSRSLNLAWNQQDILKLLIKRLGTNKAFQGIGPFIKIDGKDSEVRIRPLLMIIFPEQVEGLPFIEWITKMMRNGKNHISPRQVILFLVVLKDILVNAPTSPKQVPIFNDTDVKRAMTQLSELSYDEILSDFRISPTFIRNCRAGRISEFNLDEVKGLFSEQEGTIVSQLDLLEKLGIIERVVKIDSEQGFISRFRFPDLYTRCWYY